MLVLLLLDTRESPEFSLVECFGCFLLPIDLLGQFSEISADSGLKEDISTTGKRVDQWQDTDDTATEDLFHWTAEIQTRFLFWLDVLC